MPETHALLAPSGVKRWTECTPSARLEATFPEETSIYAEEGSTAHRWAEAKLRHFLFNWVMPIPQFQPDFSKGPGFVTGTWHPWDPRNKVMEEHVDNYVHYCMEIVAWYRQQTGKMPRIWVEKKVDLDPWIPESFGTSDFGLATEKTLHVIDLKYGEGIPVSAHENGQLMLYAFGALDELEAIGHDSIRTIRLTIYQPRLNSKSTYELTPSELKAWVREISPLADKAFKGEGEFKAGHHCQFCKLKKKGCLHYSQWILSMAESQQYQKANLLTPEQTAYILKHGSYISSWFSSIKEYALQSAIKGAQYPGFKLVEGRSNREIIKQEQVEKILEPDYLLDQFKPRKFIGISELEALVGEKYISKYLTEFIVKPKGAPTLVEESDPRPAINGTTSAVSAFKDFIQVSTEAQHPVEAQKQSISIPDFLKT